MENTFTQSFPGCLEIVALRTADGKLIRNERDGAAASKLTSTRSVCLSTKELEPFECTAALLAFLLEPEIHAHADRIKTYETICYWAVYRGLAWPRRRRRYLFQDKPRVETSLARVDKRVRQRNAAALMALPYFMKVLWPPGHPFKFPVMPRHTMAEIISESPGMPDPKNVQYRVWRASLPVLHLAVSIFLTMYEKKGSPLELVAEHDAAASLVTFAAVNAELMQIAPTLGKASAQLIRFSLS